MLRASPGGTGLKLSLTRSLPELQSELHPVSPERLLLAGAACCQTRRLSPAPSGAALGLVCVVVFPSPQGPSPCGVVSAPVEAACTPSCLWHSFGWTAAEGMLEGVGPREVTRAECTVSAGLVQVRVVGEPGAA